MKKILLLLLFSIYMAHPAFPAMKELEDLDKLIENKNQYDQLKRQRISSAKKKLAQASDAETRFNLLMEIGNEYTFSKRIPPYYTSTEPSTKPDAATTRKTSFAPN